MVWPAAEKPSCKKKTEGSRLLRRKAASLRVVSYERSDEFGLSVLNKEPLKIAVFFSAK